MRNKETVRHAAERYGGTWARHMNLTSPNRRGDYIVPPRWLNLKSWWALEESRIRNLGWGIRFDPGFGWPPLGIRSRKASVLRTAPHEESRGHIIAKAARRQGLRRRKPWAYVRAHQSDVMDEDY